MGHLQLAWNSPEEESSLVKIAVKIVGTGRGGFFVLLRNTSIIPHLSGRVDLGLPVAHGNRSAYLGWNQSLNEIVDEYGIYPYNSDRSWAGFSDLPCNVDQNSRMPVQEFARPSDRGLHP
jgi:hypothetical protein